MSGLRRQRQDERQCNDFVNIPAGVDNDSVIPTGGGEPGVNGGPDGDLYIVITWNRTRYLSAADRDLWLEIPITFDQAALGDDIIVPTLEGKVSYKVPSGNAAGYDIPPEG